MHRHLRVIGAGLDADIAIGNLGVQEVVYQFRHRLEILGHLVADTETILAVGVLEQRTTEAKGDGEPVDAVVRGFTGVSGGCVFVAFEGALGGNLQAHAHTRSRIGPVLQQLNQVIASLVVTNVEGREVHLVLLRGDDSGLYLSIEGVLQCFQNVVAGGGPVLFPDGEAARGSHRQGADAAAHQTQHGAPGKRKGFLLLFLFHPGRSIFTGLSRPCLSRPSLNLFGLARCLFALSSFLFAHLSSGWLCFFNPNVYLILLGRGARHFHAEPHAKACLI